MEILILFIILIFALMCVTYNLIRMINQVVNNALCFVNSINKEKFKLSILDKEQFILLKYQIIKELTGMIKSIKVHVLTIVAIVITIQLIGCNKDKQICVDKVTTQYNEKLQYQVNKVDGLMCIVNKMQYKIDSVTNVKDSLLNHLSIELNQVKNENSRLTESNKNLNNVIKHQNTMIKKLQK